MAKKPEPVYISPEDLECYPETKEARKIKDAVQRARKEASIYEGTYISLQPPRQLVRLPI
ncbi:MAG: hypothetical protein Athens101428_507 [Candidatus Berkelbacteria bacterium Athens1014_28]|uniref:Uncharacterized protein n=1 Tax=Candidatus Berkelbacteria bacterium Athens1014_28 TaxID=2017145 RepID=A0A554LLX0_9BACT|nr:MAG: hypothetical protein Athens101428_507 [Candidatus Berkelbacteria bacterium Athens1014_28]